MHLQCDILLLVVCCTEELYVGDLCDNIGLVLVYLPSGTLSRPSYLTLGAHTQRGLQYLVCVCVSVC